MGILQVDRNKLVIDKLDSLKRVGPFRDERLPSGSLRLGHIDRQQSSPGRFQVGLEIKYGPIIADNQVGCFQVRHELHHLSVRLQVLIKQAVACIGSLGDCQDQVATVNADFRVKTPFGVVWSGIDQQIRILRCLEPVKANRLVVIGFLVSLPVGRWGIPAVKKTAVVMRPGSSAELAPFQFFRKIRPAGNVADVPFHPIRSRA